MAIQCDSLWEENAEVILPQVTGPLAGLSLGHFFQTEDWTEQYNSTSPTYIFSDLISIVRFGGF